MANKIIIKRSSVAGKIPLATDLEVGELAVNLVDKVLFTKNASGDVVPLDQDVDYYIKASSAITKGQVVMFTGAVGASGNLTGAPATGLTAETAYAVMGIAAADIALNDWGYVTAFGNVKGVDTSAFSDGQILYLNPSVAGGLTTTIPTAPNPKVQVCAVASAASNGTLVVRPTFGGKLGQFEGDVQITSPTSGDALVWDGSKWVNSQVTGYVDADVDAHLNTATATAGQVLSWTGSDYDWVDQNGGGGGAVNGVFYENDQTVNTSYTITTNKNAMSAGPITIASGVTVTIPSGSSWLVL